MGGVFNIHEDGPIRASKRSPCDVRYANVWNMYRNFKTSSLFSLRRTPHLGDRVRKVDLLFLFVVISCCDKIHFLKNNFIDYKITI